MQMEREKKAGVTMFISDKINFKPKSVIRDEECHYTTIKNKSNRKLKQL